VRSVLSVCPFSFRTTVRTVPYFEPRGRAAKCDRIKCLRTRRPAPGYALAYRVPRFRSSFRIWIFRHSPTFEFRFRHRVDLSRSDAPMRHARQPSQLTPDCDSVLSLSLNPIDTPRVARVIRATFHFEVYFASSQRIFGPARSTARVTAQPWPNQPMSCVHRVPYVRGVIRQVAS
jgi:hypothetical protein